MNTTNTHRTATTLATAAAASALIIMSAVAPTAASAHRPDPIPDPATATRCAEGAGDTEGSSIGSMDIDEIVTMLKVRRAKYLFDHPLLLR